MTTPQDIGPADPDAPMTVTLTLRPGRPLPTDAEIEAAALKPIADRAARGRESFAAAYGADPADIETVDAWARHHGLKIADSDAARRRVMLTGRAADVASAFGVRLRHFRGPAGEYRGTDGEAPVPAGLQPAVETVLGLDDRPAARPHNPEG